MGHFDEVLGGLRRAGLSVEKTLQAYGVIFAYVYGFVLAFKDDDHVSNAKQIIEAVGSAEYPHAVEAAHYYMERGVEDQVQDFLGGLDLILEGIERTLSGLSSPKPAGAEERP